MLSDVIARKRNGSPMEARTGNRGHIIPWGVTASAYNAIFLLFPLNVDGDNEKHECGNIDGEITYHPSKCRCASIFSSEALQEITDRTGQEDTSQGDTESLVSSLGSN